jgi:hypothetical protein
MFHGITSCDLNDVEQQSPTSRQLCGQIVRIDRGRDQGPVKATPLPPTIDENHLS